MDRLNRGCICTHESPDNRVQRCGTEAHKQNAMYCEPTVKTLQLDSKRETVSPPARFLYACHEAPLRRHAESHNTMGRHRGADARGTARKWGTQRASYAEGFSAPDFSVAYVTYGLIFDTATLGTMRRGTLSQSTMNFPFFVMLPRLGQPLPL